MCSYAGKPRSREELGGLENTQGRNEKTPLGAPATERVVFTCLATQKTCSARPLPDMLISLYLQACGVQCRCPFPKALDKVRVFQDLYPERPASGWPCGAEAAGQHLSPTALQHFLGLEGAAGLRFGSTGSRRALAAPQFAERLDRSSRRTAKLGFREKRSVGAGSGSGFSAKHTRGPVCVCRHPCQSELWALLLRPLAFVCL